MNIHTALDQDKEGYIGSSHLSGRELSTGLAYIKFEYVAGYYNYR